MAKTKVGKFEILTFEAADERLDGALSECFQGDFATVLLFPGDLTVEGDFEKAVRKLCTGTFAVIAVAGDLTVAGRIRLYDDTPGLYVGGKTTAETVEGGDTEIYLHGGTFTYLVYGHYNHGILDTGKVHTPWVINADHDLRCTAGKQTRWVDSYGDHDDFDFGRDNIPTSFVPEVLGDDDGYAISVDKLYKRLAAGKPVLVTGAQTGKQAALAQVKGAKGAKKTEVVMTTKKLKAFPKDVLKMTWLTKLVLDGNEIGKVPPQIGKLTELEELSLSECGLAELPEEIGKLTKLKILRVGGNVTFDWSAGGDEAEVVPIVLPKSIAKCTALEELDVSYLSDSRHTEQDGEPVVVISSYTPPAEIAKLPRLRILRANVTNLVMPKTVKSLPALEELELSGGHAFIREVPAWVTRCKKLRRLDLSSIPLRSIPKLDSLTALEELDLNSSLEYVDALPDLSKLTRLRSLNVSGNTDSKDARPAVLRKLFGMKLAALEDLRIDRWHGLAPAALAGIGKLQKLKTLDIEFNEMKSLPPDFYQLTALSTLKLAYNKLGKKELARIKKTFPNAEIDIG